MRERAACLTPRSSATSPQKTYERLALRNEASELHEFVRGVKARAARTEAVDGGNAERRDGVRIAAATEERRLAIAEARCACARGVFVAQRGRCVGLLERETVRTAGDLDAHAGDARGRG